MIERKRRKRLKAMVAHRFKRDEFYVSHHLALPENVTAMMLAVERSVLKHGHKAYRANRERVDRFLKKLFKKYFIRKTTSERFWYLTAVCCLIGPAPEVKKKVEEKPLYEKPRKKSSTKSKKRKHGKR